MARWQASPGVELPVWLRRYTAADWTSLDERLVRSRTVTDRVRELTGTPTGRSHRRPS
jgi:hypothetical protein